MQLNELVLIYQKVQNDVFQLTLDFKNLYRIVFEKYFLIENSRRLNFHFYLFY